MSRKRKRTYRSMVVKVQISLFSTEEAPQVLVYNEKRDVWFQGDATKDHLDAMEGQPKLFFHARHHLKTGLLELMDHAAWRDW